MASVEGQTPVAARSRATPGPAETWEGWLTLAAAAQQLGLSAATLRQYARSGQFPAEKRGGRWNVLARDVAAWEQRLQAIPTSGKRRARLSEVLAFGNMQDRLFGRGRLTSPRLPSGASIAERGQAAASRAIEHQLNPGVLDQEAPLPTSRSKRRRAKLAQREALRDMLRKPGQPHPPERSL
ncbi:MAG: helix-turn-helix domain-containing protein [Chloroflexota bacterium]|nr:helix-turn-helix domain-containing protein [Chloroflexota bacterium]